jgi:integrase
MVRPALAIDPTKLSRSYRRTAETASCLQKKEVHTLRHTYATTALLGGAPIHVVSRNLGHSSVAVTADVYGHVTDDAARNTAESVSSALEL